MTTPGFKRKLSAVLMADVVGYSRLMGEDEAATLQTLSAYQGIMADLINQHRGRVVDAPGDALLAEFSSVVDAVQCAVAVQKELEARNAELPDDRRMQWRIGINLGDVIEEGNKIYGDGVNVAARLEALADPGGICVSRTAFDHIETKLPLGYEFLGEKTVKNIARPVGAYRVLLEPRVTVAGELAKEKTSPSWPKKALAAAGIIVLVAAISLTVFKSGWLIPRPEKQVAPSSTPQPPSPPLTHVVPAPEVPPAPQAAAPTPEAPPLRAATSPRVTPKPPAASSMPISPSPQKVPYPTRPTPAPQAAVPTPVAPPAPEIAPRSRVLPQTPVRGSADFFRKLDLNNDGRISLDEWMSWRETQFDNLDKNNDGFLTREEISAGRTRFARLILKNFDLVDTNQDGKLSKEEFRAASRRRFLLGDTNRDGYLSPEELENLVNPRFGRQ
jgi:class 3 adenylate cyclase/Ca2+-binding EF-hand superfamily protein